MMTASLRATATLAFLSELRLASVTPQCLSAVHCVDRLSITLAAANNAVHVKLLGHGQLYLTPPDSWLSRSGIIPRT